MITKESLVTTKDKSKEVIDALWLKHKLWHNGQSGVVRPEVETLFAWFEKKDRYGSMYVLDDYMSGAFMRAFTVPELLQLIPPMSTLTFLIFCFRTRLKPDAVADYVMNKL